jgi:hypothetical protein
MSDTPTRKDSLPPKEKSEITKLGLITHTIIDAFAIVAITTLVSVGKLEPAYGVGLIAIIAGVWLNSNTNGKPPSNGPSAILGALLGIVKFFTLWGRI